jgi:hypothetical protein
MNRGEFYQGLVDDVDVASGLRSSKNAAVRLDAIRGNLAKEVAADTANLEVDPAEATAMRMQFRALLVGHVTGEISGQAKGEHGVVNMRGLAWVPGVAFRDRSRKPRAQRALEAELGLSPDAFPANTVTRRAYALGDTGATLYSTLTGLKEGSHRPTDPRVSEKFDVLAESEGVNRWFSAALVQGQDAFEFPPNFDVFDLPDGVVRFGEYSFRTDKAAKKGSDASIITPFKEEGIVGHWSAVSGAAFGQLVEVGEGGEVTKHANLFLGPNNILGGERSVVRNAIDTGGFDLSRTFFVVEHQEGPMYARNDLLKPDHKWVAAIQARYGDALTSIIPALAANPEEGAFSPHIPRLGQAVFHISEAVRQEALHCGIAEDRLIINRQCPTTNVWNKHWSNTAESGLFPGGRFVLPGGEVAAGNVLLYPRNAYATWTVSAQQQGV